ncbi:MAG TPA: protein kinase [Pyrinomonadaceae bacterium]|jgi:serine/threonine protein kinase/tetratricopeptide (TPR) repeat protein
MIGRTVSHYRIVETLGEGGMGVVYAAEDLSLGRRVAIKFLSAGADDKQFRARFLREARAISQLSHPHIAVIYDYGETEDDQPYIVMEMVTGRNLSELLRAGPLSVRRTVEIVCAVAEALGEAHAQGIIHRDIKPSNVILNDRGHVKVLDFGLAKQFKEARERNSSDPEAQTLLTMNTQTNAVVGTPRYMSPEQAKSAPVGPRSDLFALGALLYECLTGKPPFMGANAIETIAQVIHVDPPRPSTLNRQVPPALDRVTLRALSKDVEQRYQSAEEMLDDLRAVEEVLRESGDRSGWSTRRIRSSAETRQLSAVSGKLQKRPYLYVLASLAVLVFATLVYFAFNRWWRPVHYQPTAEAQRWYERGTNALREGAYFQASKMLAQAISSDEKFALAHARLAEAWAEMDYTSHAKDEMLRAVSLIPNRSALPQLDALYMDGVNALVSRDFDSAVKAYAEIARLRPKDAAARLDLGRAYEKNDDTVNAIKSYLEAAQLDPFYGAAYLRAAVLYSRQQDVERASAALEKAESLFQVSGNLEGRTEVLYRRGALLRDTGKLSQARAQLEQALAMATANSNESQKVNALLGLSRLSYIEGSPAREQEYAKQAIAFAQQNGVEILLMRGLNELGLAQQESGDYDGAAEQFQKSLELARRNNVSYLEGVSLINLAGLRIQQLRTEEGLQYAEQARAIFEQGNYRKDISSALTSIGRARRRQGEYATALSIFEQKLQLANEASDQRQIAFSLGEIAMLLYEQERYTEALRRYEESYAISRPLGARVVLAYNLLFRSNLLWRLGRYEEARAALDEATELANQPAGKIKSLLVDVPLREAQMALGQRRFSEAQAKAQQSLDASGTQYEVTAIEAKFTLGLARARASSASAAVGRRLCEEASAQAMKAGDAALLSKALLALAEAALESGDAGGALKYARQAAERCARAGQLESLWRAHSIAGRASLSQQDEAAARDEFTRARETLSQLEQQWGSEAFKGYMARPDVQTSYNQLGGQ